VTGGGTVDWWSPTLAFHAHADPETWASAIATVVAEALRASPAARPHLLVSGGHTPGPVFRRLAQAPLDWPSVDVGLVDERWLPPTDPDSNAHLVRENLLRDAARSAHFTGLARTGGPIDAAVEAANAHVVAADVTLLGMGDDGHTASLFPHMADLDRALATTDPYIAVDAGGCPGAGPWPLRISLTPAGLAPSRMRLLLLRGTSKRDVLKQALAATDPHDFPVRLAFTTPGADLHVHWCA
jgi:6-phosphogluconolactonase